MVWNTQSVGNASLVLHCGGTNITLDELKKVKTPKGTRTHVPIPHDYFLDRVLGALKEHGVAVKATAFAIAGDNGARMFGVAELEDIDSHMSWVLGFRNAHDKSFPSEGVLGTHVFVCDNMGFSSSGESRFSFARKHTTNILRDLPGLISTKMSGIRIGMAGEAERIRGMQDQGICKLEHAASSPWVNDAIMRLWKLGALTTRQIDDCYDHFRADMIPGDHHGSYHVSMRLPTPWKLLNCVTEINRENPVEDTPRRTQIAHALCVTLAAEARSRYEPSLNELVEEHDS